MAVSSQACLFVKAIGAIASYAVSRNVAHARLTQCDAAPHDSGYLQPEALLESVQMKGRGGTVLMPGIRLLEEATDFPIDGPVLVVTDGECDVLRIEREHAFLVPQGCRISFPRREPVFSFS